MDIYFNFGSLLHVTHHGYQYTEPLTLVNPFPYHPNYNDITTRGKFYIVVIKTLKFEHILVQSEEKLLDPKII